MKLRIARKMARQSDARYEGSIANITFYSRAQLIRAVIALNRSATRYFERTDNQGDPRDRAAGSRLLSTASRLEFFPMRGRARGYDAEPPASRKHGHNYPGLPYTNKGRLVLRTNKERP